MPKRHGITNDPERRKKELKSESSGSSNLKVEGKFRSQKKAAQERENTKKNQHPREASNPPLDQFSAIIMIMPKESQGDKQRGH